MRLGGRSLSACRPAGGRGSRNRPKTSNRADPATAIALATTSSSPSQGRARQCSRCPKAYKAIVDELGASNKKISSDFESMFDVWLTTNGIPMDLVASAASSASKQIKAVKW
jgi:hypothetical protein